MSVQNSALKSYLERIGVHDALRPDLETLTKVHNAHVRSIPFENIDVLLDRGISLDSEAIEHKLLTRQRGGYCFEHNALLERVLTAIGFEVEAFVGRARVGRARAETPPRTHLWLRVALGGEHWVVDAGLGGLTPTAPLRWVAEQAQSTPHEPRRLMHDGPRWYHQAYLGEAWADVCELSLEPMPQIDREIANWFTSTHPKSDFRARLMVAQATQDGRVTLANRRLTIRRHTSVQRHELTRPRELREALKEHFGISVAAGEAEQLFAVGGPDA